MSFVRIQASSERIGGDEGAVIECAFDIFSGTKRAIKVGLEPKGDAAGWVHLDPADNEFMLPAEGHRKVKVQVKPEPGSAGRKTSFKLNVYSIELDASLESNAIAIDVNAKAVPQPVVTEPTKPFPWWIVAVAAGVLVVLGGALTFVLLSGSEVPQLVGKPADEALTLLSDADLTAEVTEELTGSAPGGQVLRTEPAGGEDVPESKVVKVFVEMVSVEVPSVIGLNTRAASEKLAAVGLALGATKTEVTRNSPGGTVIAQAIAPPGRAIPGQAIDLTIEKEQVAVPNLRGRPFTFADQLAQQRELRIQLRKEVSTGAPAGTVVNQEPGEGTSVDSGTIVLVDLERARVVVPRLQGQFQPQGELLIRQAGLVPAPVQPRYETQPPFGMIVGQVPDAGIQVPPGTPVVMIVRTQPRRIDTLTIEPGISANPLFRVEGVRQFEGGRIQVP